MDIELGVPGTWTVEKTRSIEDMVRERIGANVRGVKKVRVRFVSNSSSEPDFLDEFIPGDATNTSTADSHNHIHSDKHNHEHSDSTPSQVRQRK